MSEYKPITGELRDAMVRFGWCESDGTITVSSTPPNIEAEPFLTIAGSRFDHLCDAIDAIHAALEAENERLRECDGWVELPKDADGEHICAGDRLDGYGKTIEVVELRYGRSGWVLISRDGNAYADTFAFTHHHAPTVEDVLAEMFAKAIERGELTNGAAQTIAEYAKRLTLAGDTE